MFCFLSYHFINSSFSFEFNVSGVTDVNDTCINETASCKYVWNGDLKDDFDTMWKVQKSLTN